MYRKEESTPIPPESFELPFEGKLSSDNRWVMMADLIPWKEFESEYSSGFSEEKGAPAKSFRMALGALIIKEKLGISDRETVEQIRENPYLQYFIGMSLYSKDYTGYYPESVHVDKIYRTRENRAWCKERGIRISGVPLGRPPKTVSQEKKNQAKEDERIRNSIEGKFGQAKRRFGLNRVMAKLNHTSVTVIAITFLVINLSTQMSRFLCAFLCLFFNIRPYTRSNIIDTYDLIAGR